MSYRSLQRPHARLPAQQPARSNLIELRCAAVRKYTAVYRSANSNVESRVRTWVHPEDWDTLRLPLVFSAHRDRSARVFISAWADRPRVDRISLLLIWLQAPDPTWFRPADFPGFVRDFESHLQTLAIPSTDRCEWLLLLAGKASQCMDEAGFDAVRDALLRALPPPAPDDGSAFAPGLARVARPTLILHLLVHMARPRAVTHLPWFDHAFLDRQLAYFAVRPHRGADGRWRTYRIPGALIRAERAWLVEQIGALRPYATGAAGAAGAVNAGGS